LYRLPSLAAIANGIGKFQNIRLFLPNYGCGHAIDSVWHPHRKPFAFRALAMDTHLKYLNPAAQQ
jgi:hypothetical protein